MSATKNLRLGPLPKTENVKLTFAYPLGLKADLDRYAALHAQTYGEAVDAEKFDPAHIGGVHFARSRVQAEQHAKRICLGRGRTAPFRTRTF